MKNVYKIFFIVLFVYQCSDSTVSSDIDVNIGNDVSVSDISADIESQDVIDKDASDTLQDSSDELQDVIGDAINDIIIDVETVSDLSMVDSLSDSNYSDMFIQDVSSDDVGVEDAGMLYDVLEDISTDIGGGLVPPVLELLTPSPSELTSIQIGGSAGGLNIYIFNNKFCTSKPVMSLSSTIFNRGGVSIDVPVGSTTYFSAYVEDGNGTVSACSNFITYVHNDGRFWRITFFDDFKGPQPDEDPDCYSIPPQCIGEYLSALYECPQSEIHSGLENLNKCNWTILRQPNWMAKEYGADRNGTNGFSPLEVSVNPNLDNGVLILSANAYKWDGTALNKSELSPAELNCLRESQENWLLHESNKPDCRNIVTYNCVWNNNTNNCAIMSGAVYSKHFTNYKKGGQPIMKRRGFIQKFGRWEVRAKLPKGTGSFPAHWLLPQSGSWPERGEIDIMEADRLALESHQTYHTGYCEGSNSNTYFNNDNCYDEGGQRYHQALGGLLKLKMGTFSDDYHLFAVEWRNDRIDFYTDDVLTISIKEGDKSYGIFTDYWRYTGQARPVNIPTLDQFFIILNQTVHNDLYGKIEPLNFVTQKHYIDYVKVYNVCQTPFDFCTSGYYFDGNDGLCHPLSDSGNIKSYPSPCKNREDLIPRPKPLDSNIYYPCTVVCPFGGWFDGHNCLFFNAPSNREVFLYPYNGSELPNLYYVTDGSQDGNCYDYIDSKKIPVGHYDGANCYLDKTLVELQGKYFRWGDPTPSNFYYQPACTF